ncbi:MAG: hypothetical protein B6241_13990 [Spirochaetaceae bacterium 4572_59]|nr:MAG: hypothetical protein B6241_13990 [Spirochaetaceae bacterium 4572_59]
MGLLQENGRNYVIHPLILMPPEQQSGWRKIHRESEEYPPEDLFCYIYKLSLGWAFFIFKRDGGF